MVETVSATAAASAPASFPDTPRPSRNDTPVQPSTVADALVAPPRLLNPDPVIDPAPGIVVTECFNAAANLGLIDI